jgi:hypothetical protein
MPSKYCFKWYHWLLFPFAKKVIGIDGECKSYGFIIFGKLYIYNFSPQNNHSKERMGG